MITRASTFAVRALGLLLLATAPALLSFPAMVAAQQPAPNFPAPVTGTWVAKDFKFHTGEVTRFWAKDLAEFLAKVPKRAPTN